MHVSLIFANQNTEGRREESGEVYWKTISAGDCLDSYCQRHYIFCNECYSGRPLQ